MAIFAVIENNLVIDLIEADETFVESNIPTAIKVTTETRSPYIGSDILDGKFRPLKNTENDEFDVESWSWITPEN